MERQFFNRRLQSKKEIEVDHKNTKARWILALVFFIIAVIALTYALVSYLNQDPGWRKVETTSSELNCSEDFTLNYYLGDQGADIIATNKLITQIYTEATEQAYQLFYAHAPAGSGNLRDVNDGVGKTVTVAQPLYDALALIESYGNRSIYLAPVYVEYNRIFHSESQAEAASYDPAQNPELVDYIRELSAFANDPEQISLELLENSQVRLNISPDYREFAQRYEIDTFLDFGWMKNAFIADLIAQKLTEQNLTHGYLVSTDGFTRNLDPSGQSYGLDLLDRYENTVYAAAKLSYTGPVSMVSLRNYPLSDRDRWQYYGFDNGRIVTVMLDPKDGMSKSATDNLVGISQELGCGELLLQLAPLYVTEQLDERALGALSDIQCIWFEGTALKHTGSLQIELLQQENGPAYTIQKQQQTH